MTWESVSAEETPNRRVANRVTKEGVTVGSSEVDKLGFLPFPLPMLCLLGHSVQPQHPALHSLLGSRNPRHFPQDLHYPRMVIQRGAL